MPGKPPRTQIQALPDATTAPGKRLINMTAPDIHALTGPYVLDAVDGDERASFEQHLARCPACSIEVSDLREAVVKLAAGVTAQPPASLKPKVMTAVHQGRQTRPGVRVVQRRIVRRSLVLTAALVAIAGSGATALGQYRENAQTTAISNRAAVIAAQPDARTIHGPVTGGGQATVVLSGHNDAATVVVRDLEPLKGHKTYQLWLIDGAQRARSIGLTDGKSVRPTVVTGGVNGNVAFGVTVEPRGGSASPTLPAAGPLQPVVNLETATT
jgi:anti-sigma-K factor RskA